MRYKKTGLDLGGSSMKDIRGYIMELQNFSVNDGDGIRTNIFFAGCPLRCSWCSNPESHTISDKIAYYKKTCVNCKKCVDICENDVGIDLNDKSNRIKCNSCGKCSEICPTKSRKNLIYKYSLKDIMKVIEKQKIFFDFSDGGVTFSGGEATQQEEFLRELVNECYDKAIDMAIETCAYFEFDKVKDILEKLDLIFVDIKHMDDDKHKQFTGVGNKEILGNISKMNELKVPIVVRISVIDGVNSDIENIRATAKYIKDNVSNPKIELLPYHSFGDGKYEALGLNIPSEKFKRPSLEDLEKLYEIIEKEGVEIVSYK